MNILYAACQASGVELPEILQLQKQPSFGFK